MRVHLHTCNFETWGNPYDSFSYIGNDQFDHERNPDILRDDYDERNVVLLFDFRWNDVNLIIVFSSEEIYKLFDRVNFRASSQWVPHHSLSWYWMHTYSWTSFSFGSSSFSEYSYPIMIDFFPRCRLVSSWWPYLHLCVVWKNRTMKSESTELPILLDPTDRSSIGRLMSSRSCSRQFLLSVSPLLHHSRISTKLFSNVTFVTSPFFTIATFLLMTCFLVVFIPSGIVITFRPSNRTLVFVEKTCEALFRDSIAFNVRNDDVALVRNHVMSCLWHRFISKWIDTFIHSCVSCPNCISLSRNDVSRQHFKNRSETHERIALPLTFNVTDFHKKKSVKLICCLMIDTPLRWLHSGLC